MNNIIKSITLYKIEGKQDIPDILTITLDKEDYYKRAKIIQNDIEHEIFEQLNYKNLGFVQYYNRRMYILSKYYGANISIYHFNRGYINLTIKESDIESSIYFNCIENNKEGEISIQDLFLLGKLDNYGILSYNNADIEINHHKQRKIIRFEVKFKYETMI